MKNSPSAAALQSRRHLLRSAGAVLALAAASPLKAQSRYPSRPVHLIVPLPAGSSPDFIARLWSDQFSKRTGHPVIVENRPGASTSIAAQAVKSSVPDGHTLFWTVADTFSINPYIFPKLRYEANDFVPVTRVVSVPYVLLVSADSKFQTLDELIAAAKANPNSLNYGSAGIGSGLHLMMARLLNTAGVAMNHVPYKDSLFPDLIAQRTHACFIAATAAISQINGGRLKALGVSSPTRIEALKDVAPIAERFPGFEGDSWQGIFAPKGTPQDIVSSIAEHSSAIVGATAFRETLANYGAIPVSSRPDEFSLFLADDARTWSQFIRANGIVAE